jgi:hypothetical protein
MVPRKQAGHMTCTRPPGKRQILLAMRASSTHDPKETLHPECLPPRRSAVHASGSPGCVLADRIALVTHRPAPGGVGAHTLSALLQGRPLAPALEGE